MTTHRIQLKRSPQTFTVNNKTVMVDGTPCADSTANSKPSAHTGTSASRPKATSVAKVITNPVDRPLSPLSRSTAVPVLSNSGHDVVTAEQVGLGGVDPAEITRLQQLLADTAEALQDLQAQHRQSLGEMQEVTVELAVAAASWLIGTAIDRDLFAVDDLILKSLENLEWNQSVRVQLNPADHELLQKLLKDPASDSHLKEISYETNASISRGSVRVESGRRILVTDMTSRLEEIRRTWMEKLDDSQIERRGDGTTSRTLRRFPERRETA